MNCPDILNIDGKLSLEDYLLTEDKKNLVSARDFEKYGKVETWTNGDANYFIKQFRGGRMGSFVVNPYSMMSRASDLSAYVSTKGDSFCEYLKVKKEIFDCYRTFLETRNDRYFSSVEKAVKDGDQL